MSKTKRILSATLALTMAVMSFCSCGSNSVSIKETERTNNSEPSVNLNSDRNENNSFEPKGNIQILGQPVEREKAFPAVPDELADSLYNFAFKSSSAVLTGAEYEGVNRCYSPLSAYYAMAMLTEAADNQTREELAELLGYRGDSLSADMNTLTTSLLSASNYDGERTTDIRNSLWLSQRYEFNSEYCAKMGENFDAFIAALDFTSFEANEAIASWIADGTHGLIEPSPESFEFDIDTLAVLVNTIFYEGAWTDNLSDSYEDTFTLADKSEVTADFMKGYYESAYVTDDFVATNIPLSDGSKFTVVLPDEDVDINSVLQSEELYKCATTYDDIKTYDVYLTIPKFDISAKFDLKQTFESLGVEEAFNGDVADFSPLTTDPYERGEGIEVSKIVQEARFSIDEEGCTGAAYTMVVMDACTAAPMDPPPRLDIECDRPFIFCLSRGDSILFIGAVENPA